MRNSTYFAIVIYIFFFVVGILYPTMVWAVPQGEEMELMNRITQLEKELGDANIELRDEAEKKLIELGTDALRHLSPINDSMSSDMSQRMGRVRKALETIAAKGMTEPKTVSISGTFSVRDIIKKLKDETDNEISLEVDSLLDHEVEFDVQNATFWSITNQLLQKLNLNVDDYSSIDGKLVLSPLSGMMFDPESDVAQDRFAPIMCDTGVISMQVRGVMNNINLLAPSTSSTSLDVSIHWEPRLAPIAIEIPRNQLSYTDNKGTIYEAKGDEVISLMVQSQFNGSEFSLRLPLIPREADEIDALDGILRLLVPGRVERFSFEQIDKIAEGAWQERAESRVTFGGIDKNEDLYSLRLSLSFAQGNEAMESHYGWALENKVYLETEDGERVEPIGLETFQQSNEELGMNYLFIEIPNNATLHYETPAAVVRLELPFTIRKIPLP
ncbi:MAG: hypothetical protein R3C03_12170 [Pirellulaceae bacterium]